MVKTALILLACVMFVHQGLADAIGEALHCRFRIINCPKCLCFWSELAYLLCTRHGLVVSVSVAFICSYIALWLELGLSFLARIYNRLYDEDKTEAGPSEDLP